MPTLDAIRKEIKNLYESNPNIHINVNLTSPRINLSSVSVLIRGVYPNIFRIEELDGVSKKTYTVQYKDVLMNRIEIIELKS